MCLFQVYKYQLAGARADSSWVGLEAFPVGGPVHFSIDLNVSINTLMLTVPAKDRVDLVVAQLPIVFFASQIIYEFKFKIIVIQGRNPACRCFNQHVLSG